jgi:hypothetical protein
MLALALLLLPLPHGRVIDFHVDEEHWSGSTDQPAGPNNRSKQTALCTTFLDQLHNLSSQLKLHSAGLPEPLTLSVDAGTCPPDAPPAPAAGSCFNLSYKGVSTLIAAHVVDVADRTVLMDYDSDPARVVSRALPFLTYAESIEKVKGLKTDDDDDDTVVSMQCTTGNEKSGSGTTANWPTYHFMNNVTRNAGALLLEPLNDANAIAEYKGASPGSVCTSTPMAPANRVLCRPQAFITS